MPWYLWAKKPNLLLYLYNVFLEEIIDDESTQHSTTNKAACICFTQDIKVIPKQQ